MRPTFAVGIVVGVLTLSGAAFAAAGLSEVSLPAQAPDDRIVLTPVPAPGSPESPRKSSASGASGPSIDVDPTWVADTATGAGIPVPALRAYAVATLRVGREQPGCGLGWTTLAGIGEVESVHGTIGGRRLEADGRSDRPVLGPALDGSGQVAAIAASEESSRWHGDPSWDHAVGPLQFIPSSWQRWASDGDGDGSKDPNDIDDAAYAAARYLCADGHSLEGAGWGEAVLSYNHSDAYVRSVYDAAATYAARTG